MQARIYEILTAKEADEARVILETQEWQEGKARTEELTGYIKRNKELKPKVDGEIVTALSAKVTQKIVSHPDLNQEACLLKMTGVKFNKYDQDTEPAGGEYRRHTDAPWMGTVRTDFTVVLALSDPDDYEGGIHYVADPLREEPWEFTLKKGECLVYETGYAHWVTPVTKGSRICALSWIESQFGSERQRGIVSNLRKLSTELEKFMLENKDEAHYRKWFVDVGVAHSGLYRMWAHRT